MKIEIEIDSEARGNDALKDKGICELKIWALSAAIDKVNNEADDSFCLRDYNGNTVGRVRVTASA